MNPSLQQLQNFAYLLTQVHKPVRQQRFRTQRGFEKAMRALKLPESFVEHERGHAKKARELGYGVVFGIRTYYLPIVGIVHTPYVKPKGLTKKALRDPKKLRDLVAICKNVSDMSPFDVEHSHIYHYLSGGENDSN